MNTRDLVAERARKGLTQRDMSLKLGISLSKYSRIETGKTSPTLDTVAKIIDVLQIGDSPERVMGIFLP